MHIAGNATLCHLIDYPVAVVGVMPLQAYDIQVSAGCKILSIVFHGAYAEWLECPVVLCDDFSSSLQQLGITVVLHQSDGCHDISHVAFIQWGHDVILP